MFVEYALRFSASAISSVAATSAFRITSNEIGIYRHPYTSRARSALTFPSRTSRATSSRSRSSGGPYPPPPQVR